MVENKFSSHNYDLEARSLHSSAEQTRRAKSHWHSLEWASKEKQWVSENSVHKGKWPRPSSDASVLMLHITSRYVRHESSLRGWQQAGSESDNGVYPYNTPRMKPICTHWPECSITLPPSSTSSSPVSLALSGYRCVIHRRTHSGGLIGATWLNKDWHTASRAPGQTVTAHRHITLSEWSERIRDTTPKRSIHK